MTICNLKFSDDHKSFEVNINSHRRFFTIYEAEEAINKLREANISGMFIHDTIPPVATIKRFQRFYLCIDLDTLVGFETINHKSLNYVDRVISSKKEKLDEFNVHTKSCFIYHETNRDLAQRKVAYEVGSGIGNITMTLPTIEFISKALSSPVTVIYRGGKKFVDIFERSPYVGKVVTDYEYITGVWYDFYVKSSIAPPRLPLVISDNILDLAQSYEYNLESRCIHESLFHLLPVSKWLKNYPEFRSVNSLSPPRIHIEKNIARSKEVKRIGVSEGKSGYPWENRRWPHFSQLVERLKNSNFEVVSLGAPDEYVPGTINHTGISFRESLDILLSLDAFIGPDGGLCHIAEALDIPTIWLFGPTGATKNGPVKTNQRVMSSNTICSPCLYKSDWFECNNNICMNSINARDVENSLYELLSIQSAEPGFRFTVYFHEFLRETSFNRDVTSWHAPIALNQAESLQLLSQILREDDILSLHSILNSELITLDNSRRCILNQIVQSRLRLTKMIDEPYISDNNLITQALSKAIKGLNYSQQKDFFLSFEADNLSDTDTLSINCLNNTTRYQNPLLFKNMLLSRGVAKTKSFIPVIKQKKLSTSDFENLLINSRAILINAYEKNDDNELSIFKLLEEIAINFGTTIYAILENNKIEEIYEAPIGNFSFGLEGRVGLIQDLFHEIDGQVMELSPQEREIKISVKSTSGAVPYQKDFHLSAEDFSTLVLALYRLKISNTKPRKKHLSESGGSFFDISLDGQCLIARDIANALILANPFYTFGLPDNLLRHIRSTNMLNSKTSSPSPYKSIAFVFLEPQSFLWTSFSAATTDVDNVYFEVISPPDDDLYIDYCKNYFMKCDSIIKNESDLIDLLTQSAFFTNYRLV